MKIPVLETQRLILRPISLDDAPAIQKYFNNWNIIKNLSMNVPWPYPDDGAEDFIKNRVFPEIANRNWLLWVIIPKSGPEEAIGIIHFSHTEYNGGQRGFWLAEPFQGQGLMTEAITALNDFLFFILGIERFTVTNAKSNLASRRVKEKTGARFLGYIELLHHNGESLSEQWEITRENWTKIRNKSGI